MEEIKTISTRDQLLILATAIILGGIASNYSITYPSSSHLCMAKGLAKELLNSILGDNEDQDSSQNYQREKQ